MNILFDIGRVLLDFDFEPALSRLLPTGCTDGKQRIRALLGRKDEFEAGRIDVDHYVEWALETLGSKATAEEFHEAWRKIFTPNQPMWQCAHSLAAQGHRLILFSNINGIHSPWIFKNFPDFSIFHGAILSYETGFIKPQPEIYHHAIERFSLNPSETLYIDDMTQNIETGRELGFCCWQYELQNHAAFETWLASQLKSEI